MRRSAILYVAAGAAWRRQERGAMKVHGINVGHGNGRRMGLGRAGAGERAKNREGRDRMSRDTAT
jgi:hypothetical protein